MKRYFFLMMMIGLSSPIISYAADIFIQPRAGSTAFVDDNVRLTNLDIDTIFVSSSFIQADVNYLTEKSLLKLTPQFQLKRFSEDIGLDAENYFLDLEGQYSIRPNLELGITGEAISDIAGQQDVNISGLSFQQVERETWSISPSITYTYNLLHEISAYYYRKNISYSDSAVVFNLQGYDYEQFGLNYNYRFSEKLSAGFAYTDSTFETDTLETKSESLQLTANYLFNETLSFFAQYGFNESESKTFLRTIIGNAILRSDTDGEVFSFGFQKQFQTFQVGADISRTVSPGALGDQNVRDTLNVNASKSFNEKLMAQLELKLVDNKTETDFRTRSFRNFESSTYTGSLVYRYSNKLNFSGGYTYRDLTRTNQNIDIDSNRLFIKLNYSFDRISI